MLRTLFALLLALVAVPAAAQDLPRIESRNGRHALIVDGEPFLVLGVQAHNSSNYPSMLSKVWPMVKRLHANTLEIPVGWEQVEPAEGKFDFSYLETLVKQAREQDVRLVLLWFASWKNGNIQYAPEWVKTDPKRFPRKTNRDGSAHFTLTPHSRANVEADKRAFVRLMQWLKENDRQNTVIMVQPQNESGNWNIPRDYAAGPDALFKGQVPAELVRGLNKKPGTWTQVFGKIAEQAFTSWHTARYIDEIAAAGKAVKPLPMYCNAALGDAFNAEPDGNGTPSGACHWNVIDIWKVAAPHLDIVAPDIYAHDWKTYLAYLDHYARADNPLFVPETGNSLDMARFFWPALGRGAIGIAPFGMDGDDYSNYPLGAKQLDEATLDAWAANYRLFRPAANAWARIALEKPVWGAAKGPDAADQSTVMGRWKVTAQFELWQFGERESPWLVRDPHPTKGQPVGGLVVAQLGPDEFLAAGVHTRLRIGLANPAKGEQGMQLRIEQGHFDARGNWVFDRLWNGDQVDYGLNFTGTPVWLKIRMGSVKP